MEELLGLSVRTRDGAGWVERSIVWLVRVVAWVATVVRCLTEREAREGQRQKLYVGIRRKML